MYKLCADAAQSLALQVTRCPSADVALLVAQLPQLRQIEFSSSNKLDARATRALLGLTALETLILSSNEHVGHQSVVGGLAGLQKLRHLDLSFCESIKPAGLRHMSSLTALTALILRCCTGAVTDKSLAHVAPLKALVELNMYRACQPAFTGAGLRHLWGLMRLRRLSLSNAVGFETASLAHLQPLTALVNLTLSDRTLRDGDLSCLAVCERLRILDISENDVLDDSCLEHLKRCCNMRSVIATDTAITEAGAREALPAVSVEAGTSYSSYTETEESSDDIDGDRALEFIFPYH